MLPFSEKVRRMNAARAAMQAQHEAGASAAPTTNSPAAANQEAPTEPNSQVAASPSAAVDRRSHEDKRTVSYVRKRDVIVQELLSQRKSLASPEQTPVPVPAAAAAARLPQEQLVAGMRSRIYLNSIASRRFTSYKAEELSARVSPIAAETAGGRAGQKRKQSPLTAAPASKYFDKDLHGEDTNTVSVLDSDDGEEKEEEEEEEVVEDSRQRRQQLQRHERQETHPSKRTKKTSRQKSSMTTPPGTTNGTVLDVFDKAFATRIKIEEKNTEAAILKDEENQEEEKEEEDALQTAGVPHTTLMNTIPLLHPPPPSEYRLRFDESGNEIPLTGISSEVEVEEEAYLDLAVPGSIAKYLRPYQQAGVKFLLKNYARGNGALLADDMGLGKTLQAIAFLSAVLGKSGDPRVDKDSPKLPQFERLKRNVDTDTTGNTQEDGNTPPTKSTATGIDLSDDFYEPDYRFGAPILIVCPTSLIDNWAAEFLKWGTFRVIKLRSNAIDTGVARLLAGDAEVGIASYDGIRNTSEKFSKVPWHVVVFDEAHKLKNPKAGQTEAAARLPTRLRFALTGTPMANDYEELFNVLNFVVPGKLGTSHQFKDNISTKIKYGMRKGATEEEIEEGNSAQIKLQELLRPFMLRRLKSIIAHEMPKKKDNVVFCQLAPLQMKAYKRALQLPDVKLLILKAQDPCPCGLSGDSVKKCMHADCPGYYKLHYNQGGLLYPHFHFCECDNVYDPISNPTGCKYHNPDGCWRFFQGQRHRACPYCLVLPLMMILKKIALHLDLIKANPEDEKIDPVKFAWQKEVADAILGTDAVAVGGNVQTLRHMDMSNIAASCGKIAALKVLLAKWAADVRGSGGLPHKVLVFSNSVRMLKIVRKMAENAGYSHEYLTGETPQADRQKIVNSFNAPNSKAFLFFVSTEAGGVGLNLTAANKVVILDPSYSPAADLQAMDRAFRIGQKRDVDVYRLVAAGTVEERIYMRQISKQQHINVAVDGSAHQKRLFTGVKGDKRHKGELWGFENMLGSLLKDEAERFETMEIVGATTKNKESDRSSLLNDGTSVLASAGPGAFEVRAVPEEITAELQRVTEVVAEATAAGRYSGGGGGGGGDVEDGFDPGLEAALLEDENEEEQDTMEPRGQQRQELTQQDEDDTEVLNLPGVKGIVDHTLAMAPDDEEELTRKDAGTRHNAARDTTAEKEQTLALAVRALEPVSALECLAVWKKVTVRELAKMMVEMSEKERTELRRAYCESAPREGLFPSSR